MKSDTLTDRRILLYLAITFGITYLAEFGILWPMARSASSLQQGLFTLVEACMMFVPSLGVLLTRLFTKEGFRDSYIVPKTGKKCIPYFLMAYFGPSLLTAAGAALYFLLFPGHLDTHMGYIAGLYAAQGVPNISPAMLRLTALAQIAAGIFLGPLLNCITCFGEEWGWRGYLLPKMLKKLPVLPVLLINGIIWGLWHMPLTILGHNYGLGYAGYPVTGILAMCLFCTVIGTCFSYVTIRTGSCLPAVLAHGALNALAAAPSLFTADGGNPFIGPVPTGIVGGSAFLVCAVIMAVRLMKRTAD